MNEHLRVFRVSFLRRWLLPILLAEHSRGAAKFRQISFDLRHLDMAFSEDRRLGTKGRIKEFEVDERFVYCGIF